MTLTDKLIPQLYRAWIHGTTHSQRVHPDEPFVAYRIDADFRTHVHNVVAIVNES